MLKRIEWKHKLRPKALRQEIVWNLALPASRGNVVDEIYDRFPECHRRRDDPTCVYQDRSEIANIIQPLDLHHPKFDFRKYDAIVKKANARLIHQVFHALVFSLVKHIDLHDKILDDSRLSLEMSKYVLLKARAHLESVKALGKLIDALLKCHRALASMDDYVAHDTDQSNNHNVKPQSQKQKKNLLDDKLIRLSDYVRANYG